MNYVIEFECAAVVLILVLWGLFYSRRSSITRSTIYFSVTCLGVFGTAFFDVMSVYCINHITTLPLWLNYLCALLFMFFYIFSGATYLLYVDSLAKIKSIKKPIKVIMIGMIIYESLLCVTAYWSHLYVYFDENLNYSHGPLFYGNYIFAFGAMIACIVILNKGRAHFSIFQRRLLCIFIAGLFVSNVYQFFNPHVLLAGFTMYFLCLFTYIAFENPAYYFYKETYCQNKDAFTRTMKLHIRAGEKFSLVIGFIDDYNTIMKSLSTTQKENFFKSVADLLAQKFGRNAFMLGGDHFAVKVAGRTDDLVMEHQTEYDIMSLFAEKLDLRERHLKINVNTAIIPSKYKFKTVDELEGVVELLMAMAKSANMDDYQKVELAINRKHRHDEIERAVEKAIENDGFMVYYQPIFNVNNGKFESAEALVRLIDDELGFIPPDEFIPITEQCGQIVPLGEIVFKKVCQFINKAKEDNLGLKYIEVNMSPVQCEKRDIVDVMFSIMEECHTDPKMINFEITETAEAEFAEGSLIVANIVDMNERGVNFSIDDFGSGFSAMDHLFSVPVELVKVDKMILWQAMKDENAMIVLKSTFDMIHRLNKKILVEGVENQEMVDILKANGCDYMQGYYFSKPIPEAEYVAFVRENNKSFSVPSPALRF